jgi:hypothetical protein
MTSVKILRVSDTAGTLIDGGSNICVTGDLNTLLDVTNITPNDISVALDGVPSSVDDKITKRGLLPLTLSDGTTYYQTSYRTLARYATCPPPWGPKRHAKNNYY